MHGKLQWNTWWKVSLLIALCIPFLKGLFLKEAFYPAFAVMVCIFAWIAVKGKTFYFDRPVLVLFGLQCTWGLVTTITAINKGEAVYGLLQLLLPFAVYLIVLQIMAGKGITTSLPATSLFSDSVLVILFISGTLISLINFGVEAVSSHPNGFIRFAWAIPYANTLALYLFAGSLAGFTILGGMRRKGPLKALAAAAVCINISALVLTYSRTMWILGGIFLLLYTVLQKDWKQRAGILFILFLTVAAVMLFQSTDLFHRASTITAGDQSFQERLAYYRDAPAMIRDHPVFGLGAGGWESAQFQYQTAVYFPTYIHSSLLQKAMDYGMPGLLLFPLQLWAFALYSFRALKRNPGRMDILCPVLINLVILLHSIIDLDFEFPLMTVLFWVNTAILSTGSGKPPREWRPGRSSKYLLASLSFVLAVAAVCFFLSNAYYSKGLKAYGDGKFEAAEGRFRMASALDPFLGDSRYMRSRALEELYKSTQNQVDMDKAIHSIRKAEALNRCDPGYVREEAVLLGLQGDNRKSVETYRRLLNLQPLFIENYEDLSAELVKMGEPQMESNGHSQGRETFLQALSLQAELEQTVRKLSPFAMKLKHKPALTVSPKLAYNMSVACCYLSRFSEAKQYFLRASEDESNIPLIEDLKNQFGLE